MSEARVRVLVVNDDAALVRSVRALLVDAGYEVEVALDGAEGLNRLSHWPADLVLLDLIMPRLDGWGFLTALQGDAPAPRPSVLVWSVASEDELERARLLGAVECLARSKTAPMQLLEAVERHVAARAAIQPTRNSNGPL